MTAQASDEPTKQRHVVLRKTTVGANAAVFVEHKEHPARRIAEVGRSYEYLPREGKGLVDRRGGVCTVIKASPIGTKNPSALVRFPDGHQARVPTRVLQRVVYKDAPTEKSEPILDDLRAKGSYKTLLQHAAEIVTARDLDIPTSGEERVARGHAAKMVRQVMPSADLSRQRDLAERLLRLAVQEAERRYRRRGERRREAFPGEKRRETLLAVHPESITRAQREEHNAIARSILTGDCTPDRRVAQRVPQLPSQPKRYEPSGQHEDAYRAMVNHAMLVVRYELEGNAALRAEHAALAEDARAVFEAKTREVEALEQRHYTGRYFEGEIFFVQCELDDGDVETCTFRLVAVYGDDGCSVVIANAVEIENTSGILVGEDGWRALARWIERHDDRLTKGAQRGGQFEDEDHLVWQENSGSLRLRPLVKEQFASMVHALEAIRCLLRVEKREA